MKNINLRLFAFCLICLFVLKTKAQVVSTFAGSGVAGSNDGTGISATFKSPTGVCTDAFGNIFVADFINHIIRKITSVGVVTTFAGSGVSGGTDGIGIAASFNYPQFICTDASNNLYVSEYFAHRIRKITPAGVVTTFAGSGVQGSANGIGTAASFNWPTGICADPSGNIYVAEAGNHKIRKITPSGFVTDYAIGVSGPNCICFDGSGNLYAVGGNTNLVLKISPFGNVTTFAGSGAASSINGTGIAASFNNPIGICIDASGNLYVSEGYGGSGGLIRKITPAAVVTTYAGTGALGSIDGPLLSATFNDPNALCFDTFGNMYIGDEGNNKIRKIGAPCSDPLAPTNTTPLLNQTICSGLTTILSASSTGTVTWYATPTGTTVLGSGTSYTTPVLSPGTYTYFAEASTCTISATRTAITVTVNATPTISVNSGTICSGNSFTINPSGASTYTISGGSAVVSPTTNVSYNVTGISALGCVSSNTAVSSVTVNALPNITAITNNSLLCTGETASLTASGASTYLWNTSATTSVIAISPTVTTNYTVTGTDANGCSNSSTITQSVSLCTGISASQSIDASLNVFPNPTNDLFTITGVELNTTITIYNAIGELVKSTQSISTNTTIDLSDYSNGIYFVKIKNNNAEAIHKLIKQ